MMPAPVATRGADLRRLVEGHAGVADGVRVRGLSVDSRRIRGGDAFFALPGTRVDGARHIGDAVAAGAAAVVCARGAAPAPMPVPVVEVDDPARCLGDAADRFFGEPSRHLPVAGVTGTNGKTSVAWFVASALDAGARAGAARCGYLGTLGYGTLDDLEPAPLTTPDAVAVHAALARLRDAGAPAAVMEVSSHALAQSRVAGVRFAAAAFTNLSRDHLDYHRDMEDYGAAKARLFDPRACRLAVVNRDDPFGASLLGRLRGAEVLAYGLAPLDDAGLARPGAASAGLLAGEVMRSGRDGLAMRVRAPQGDGAIATGLLGAFNAYNLLAALGLLLGLGVDLPRACQALGRVQAPPGRMQRFGADGRWPLVVVDYSHTPASLAGALQALREISVGRLWCVFGAGGDRDRGKRPQMGAAAAAGADELIVTDDNPRHEDGDRIVADILAGIDDRARVRVERDRACAIEAAIAAADPRDTVLVAGKGHETYQEIGAERLPFSDAALVRRLLAEDGA